MIFLPFFRWHPEVALRYIPVVRQIRSLGETVSVLDVGSGGMGIAPYLGRRVVGIDPLFNPPFHPYLKRVVGSILSLPFQPSSFDAVVCVDMLEHIGKSQRKIAIQELIRVAAKKMILAVPCGKLAYEQDKILSSVYEKVFGKEYPYLKEQMDSGLPDASTVRYYIDQAGKKYQKVLSVQIVDNENLKLRYFLMKGWMTKNIFIDFFFRKVMLFALPLLQQFNTTPAYRKIFIVDIIK